MKKKVVFLFFILIGLGLVYSQTITVTNPTAGKVWCKGQPYTITWTRTGTMPNLVKIWLRNPASTQTILEISAQTENDGSFSWPVPGTIANGNYRIRVVTGAGAIWGDSGIFEITNCAQGSITVSKPTANDVWCKGKTHSIQWTKSGQLPNTVRIVLLDEPGTASVQVIDPGTANNGSYDWKIPDSIANGKYRIRVRAVEGGVLGTFGDSPPFSIKKCFVFRFYSITVTEPHDGAHWDGGESHNIEWETGYKSNLKIQLYDYNGKNLVRDITNLRTFPTTAPGKYYFPWPIPTDISPGNYTIRVSNQTDTVKGFSKKFFIRQKLVTKTYYVPVATVNKCRWHEHDSRTDYPLIGKEFVTSIGEYPDPGAGKMRVGFQNYYHSSDYHKHYIYRSFLGVNIDPYKVGKGFFLKATLQYVPIPHISQPAAKGDLRLYYLDEAWNGTWEHLFNIKANILSSSTDVTQVVRYWLLGTSPNYGFLMVGPNEMMQNNSDYCIYTTTKVMLKLEFLQQAQ